jgi:hypothetical protein
VTGTDAYAKGCLFYGKPNKIKKSSTFALGFSSLTFVLQRSTMEQAKPEAGLVTKAGTSPWGDGPRIHKSKNSRARLCHGCATAMLSNSCALNILHLPRPAYSLDTLPHANQYLDEWKQERKTALPTLNAMRRSICNLTWHRASYCSK